MKRMLGPFAALASCLMLTSIGFAQGNVTPIFRAPTASASKLIDGDANNSSVQIVNNGSVTVYVGTSAGVTAAAGAATDGIPVFPNTYLTLKNATNSLYGVTASGTGNLRITVARSGASVETGRLATTGAANGAAANTMPMSNGADLTAGNVLFYNLTTAITPNSTTTSTASGTLAITSNATGLGSIFRSDGTNWQLLANYSGIAAQTDVVTIATTGNTDSYVVAPYAAAVTGVDCSGTSALSASDTNYITFSITNLGQSGAGTNPILAATAANTTQATGGSALSADTKRSLTLNGTGSNLIVVAGDRLRFRAAATGTLGGTVTFWKCAARFTRLS